MSDRLPPPGPSFVREREIRVGDRTIRIGMSRPATLDDGWWIAVLWAHDDDGVVSFDSFAPPTGAPAEPPIARLGRLLAGGLSGLILEEDNRLSIRLGPIVPPADPTRTWQAPVAVRAAFKWEPARAATMRPNELADTVAAAFVRALERV